MLFAELVKLNPIPLVPGTLGLANRSQHHSTYFVAIRGTISFAFNPSPPPLGSGDEEDPGVPVRTGVFATEEPVEE